MWIGAFADKALERALRWDGWCLWFPPAIKDLKPQVEAMREWKVVPSNGDQPHLDSTSSRLTVNGVSSTSTRSAK